MRVNEIMAMNTEPPTWSLGAEGQYELAIKPPIEYDNVRIDSFPVSTCWKTEKLASNVALALLIGTENPSQSPAGDIGVAGYTILFDTRSQCLLKPG